MNAHEEYSSICCAVQQALRNHKDAHLCFHLPESLWRCTRLLRHLQGMACNKDTVTTLCQAATVYMQTALLSRCHPTRCQSSQECGVFTPELVAALQQLCCFVCASCSGSLSDKVITAVESLAQHKEDDWGLLSNLQWILLFIVLLRLEGNACDSQCVLTSVLRHAAQNWDLSPVLSSLDCLAHFADGGNGYTTAVESDDGPSLQLSNQQNCIPQAVHLVRCGKYPMALEVLYRHLSEELCQWRLSLLHLLAGYCHLASERCHVALFHFNQCLSGDVPLALVFEYMAYCYQKLDLHSCQLEMWTLTAQALEQSTSASGTVGKVYVVSKGQSLKISPAVPYSDGLTALEVEYVLCQRLVEAGRHSVASTRLVEVLKGVLPQQTLLSCSQSSLPVVHLTSAWLLMLQSSMDDAEQKIDDVVDAYGGSQEPGVDADQCFHHCVLLEGLYLKGYCLLARKATQESVDVFKRCLQLAALVQTSSRDRDVLQFSEQLEMMAANSLSMALVEIGKLEDALLYLTGAVSKFEQAPLQVLYNYCQLLKMKGLLSDSYSAWLKRNGLQFSSQREGVSLLTKLKDQAAAAKHVGERTMINFHLESAQFSLKHTIFH